MNISLNHESASWLDSLSSLPLNDEKALPYYEITMDSPIRKIAEMTVSH